MITDYTKCNVEYLFEKVEKVVIGVENSVESVDNYPLWLKVMVKSFFNKDIRIKNYE